MERLSNARTNSGQLRSEAELDRVLPEIILLTPVDHLLARCERKTAGPENDVAMEARINF